QYTHHPGLADAFVHLDTEFLQLGSDEACRPLLLKPELGMGMDIPPPRRHVGGEALDLADQRHQATSNSPAAPMPPPMHMVTTTSLAPRRLPSISAWPTRRAPLMP